MTNWNYLWKTRIRKLLVIFFIFSTDFCIIFFGNCLCFLTFFLVFYLTPYCLSFTHSIIPLSSNIHISILLLIFHSTLHSSVSLYFLLLFIYSLLFFFSFFAYSSEIFFDNFRPSFSFLYFFIFIFIIYIFFIFFFYVFILYFYLIFLFFSFLSFHSFHWTEMLCWYRCV